MNAEFDALVFLAHAPGDVTKRVPVQTYRIKKGTPIEEAVAAMEKLGFDKDALQALSRPPVTLAAKAADLKARAEDRSGLLAARILLGVAKARHAIRRPDGSGKFYPRRGTPNALDWRHGGKVHEALRD